MTERDKVTVDDIIGIVHTDEPTDSVQLKKEAQLSICEKRVRELEKGNEQLKQQLSDINGQLVMLDNCDNWDYDRMKHTVREIAEIIGYNGTINPKR